MSEMRDQFEEMTTEELEAFFNADVMLEEGEDRTEQLLCAMEVYAERMKDEPHKTAEESYADFCRPRLSAKKERTSIQRFLRPIAAVAAVFVLVLGCVLTARSAGCGSYFKVGSLTGGNLAVFGQPDPEDDPYGVIDRMKPQWVPERFELSEEKIRSDSPMVVYLARYVDGDANLQVVYQYCPYPGTVYNEKNPGDVEICGINGLEVYLFKNMDRSCAVWYVDSTHCSICGDVSMDEMKQIVNSIGK